MELSLDGCFEYFANVEIRVFCCYFYVMLAGNSEIGAHAKSNLFHLICLRHVIRSRGVTNWIFSPKRPIIIQACAACSELPSNIHMSHGIV